MYGQEQNIKRNLYKYESETLTENSFQSNKVQIMDYYCKADAWDFAMNLAFGNTGNFFSGYTPNILYIYTNL